jgi:hypothetical protein
MGYLLDADVFIRAKRDHYRFPIFPCFWKWIEAQSTNGIIHSVSQVKIELDAGQDDLATWAKARPAIFLAPNAQTTSSMAQVSQWVQDPSRKYTAQARATFLSGADYWLVSEGLSRSWTVVTHEVPSPDSKNRIKIPDVCVGLGVSWMSPFQMLEEIGATFP